MAQKKKDQDASLLKGTVPGCCSVESIVSVDERGQMVLPKELRAKAGIRPGDKLALTSWQKDGSVCCITLTKVDGLEDMMKAMLGPVMKEIIE